MDALGGSESRNGWDGGQLGGSGQWAEWPLDLGAGKTARGLAPGLLLASSEWWPGCSFSAKVSLARFGDLGQCAADDTFITLKGRLTTIVIGFAGNEYTATDCGLVGTRREMMPRT